jgi:hypothetical protein
MVWTPPEVVEVVGEATGESHGEGADSAVGVALPGFAAWTFKGGLLVLAWANRQGKR